MAAEYMHIGIPVLNKKPNMVYNEWGGFWVNESVDAYDYKIEYLKFEEGTRFPEILSKQPHVAYKVDNMDPYLKEAQREHDAFADCLRALAATPQGMEGIRHRLGKNQSGAPAEYSAGAPLFCGTDMAHTFPASAHVKVASCSSRCRTTGLTRGAQALKSRSTCS